MPAIASADDQGEQLRRTMAEIALLNSQVAQRKAEASEIRDALFQQLQTIKSEAINEAAEKGIRTPAEALDNPRIFHDLALMAEIQAYIARYTQKIGFYRVACDRLGYLHQQADDELKIVSARFDLKIEALISQAKKVIDDYLPEAQTIVIHPKTLTIETPQKIWPTLNTGG